mgnify:CR=1 FL=1
MHKYKLLIISTAPTAAITVTTDKFMVTFWCLSIYLLSEAPTTNRPTNAAKTQENVRLIAKRYMRQPIMHSTCCTNSCVPSIVTSAHAVLTAVNPL